MRRRMATTMPIIPAEVTTLSFFLSAASKAACSLRWREEERPMKTIMMTKTRTIMGRPLFMIPSIVFIGGAAASPWASNSGNQFIRILDFE